jgi:hypothetical protein
MDVHNFSTADQWAPMAEAALLEARRKAVRRGEHKPQVPSLLEVATTLKLTV